MANNCKSGKNWTMYNDNCFNVLPHLQNVDCILCDPPYATTSAKWDNALNWTLLWPMLLYSCKSNAPIILFGKEPFSSFLRMSNIKKYKHEWYWNKGSAANFLNAKRQPLALIENVMVFNSSLYYPILTDGKARTHKVTPNKETLFGGIKSGCFIHTDKNKPFDKRYPYNVLNFSKRKEVRYHPTQKPVALLEYILKTYTKEGDTVLDFTCGCGSTAIACLKTNRNFIGIELDKDYYKCCIDRIKNGE